jgi:hypothetical protein
MWRLSPDVILMARVQGSTHARWTVTWLGPGQEVTISVTRSQARELLETLSLIQRTVQK